MPWIGPDGKEYKLCLLDTNIISEISKNPSREGKKFVKKVLENSWIPCITSGSLFEIRKNSIVYDQFLEVFSIIPFFNIKPFINLYESEKEVYEKGVSADPIQLSISPTNKDPKLQLIGFMDEIFSRSEVNESEKYRRSDETQVLNNWISRVDNFKTDSDVANAKDAERYVDEAAFQTILKIDLDLDSNFIRDKVEKKEFIDILKFPSVLLMLYSQYYRLYDPGWKSTPQEVTDVEIMAAVPYVDVVITENYQAEILRKVQNRGRHVDIKSLQVLTLRDLRNN